MSSTTRSLTSSISPFRSRKSPAPLPRSTAPKGAGARRTTTPSSTSSKSRLKPTITPFSSGSSSTQVVDRPDSSEGKENVTVTVRFRPLGGREINKGDEVAWFADGDYTVRNEYNQSIAYGFDRVFGPATTTRHVYDVAAQHVVSGAMEGVNGSVFAYGVTSSGKTHTMHGEQKSPGIIPLAVKDVFGIINDLKETTSRCHYCKNSADFSLKNRGFGKTEEFEKEETYSRFQRQASLISVLSDKDRMESELRNRLDEAKRHERDLENELSNMWDIVAKMKNSGNYSEDVAKTGVKDEYTSVSDQLNKVQNADEMSKFDEFKDRYEKIAKNSKNWF